MRHHPLSFLTGLAAGALLMYYWDAASGGRRRALVRDKLVGAGHELAWYADAKRRRAADRLRGMMATHSFHGRTRSEPQSDQQLHERIRARLGRVISHPKALHVEVDRGCVCLTGSVLRKEVDALLREVRSMPGVHELRNELQVHDGTEGVPELQGRTEPPGRVEQQSLQ